MTVRIFFLIFFLILTSLAGANLLLGFLINQNETVRTQSQRRLAEITLLSQDLVISSQWATRFARGYVATKDPKRMAYYTDLDMILDGKIARPKNYGIEYWDFVVAGFIPEPDLKKEGKGPLEDQFLKLDITVEEFNQLKKARELYAKVSNTEKIAMHAVNGEFDDGTGAFARRGKPDMAMAQRLIYSDDYNRENGELSKAVFEFDKMVRRRYTARLDEEEARGAQLVGFNTGLAAALFSVVVASALFLRQKFAIRGRKLMAAVEAISKGDLDTRIDVAGHDEIGGLGQALGAMAHNLKCAFAALEEKVKTSEQAAIELNNERIRSEKLLHNILPATIAQRLQGGEGIIAEVFPEVTVFFSDIVGFTEISSKLGPHETVSLLNTLYEEFDELVEHYGIEKIKTIGDSYMVVGGVPNRNPLHCQHVAEFALAAMTFVQQFSSTYPIPIRMRMGIHTGTVAAGVLGRKKFSYDLWGDVVNVASRYESSSIPDKIHVSEAVKVRLADDFIFVDAGTVDLKGKGTVPSFYLVDRKTETPGSIDFGKR